MRANLLIVSDLHFGEDLLPGASAEKQRAVALGAHTFCEFLRHHSQRRMDGKPWRLVVAGDLFDFMSVTLSAAPGFPARDHDERRSGRRRSVATGPARLARIAQAHQGVFAELMRFAAAGHEIDLIVGNHDIELLEVDTQAELRRQLLAAAPRLGAAEQKAALERICVRPWFVYLPKVAWIEHGHVYDEACSFERGQAPFDPVSGDLLSNVDDAAVRYLAQAAPELDPHGTEEWGFTGYLRYSLGRGVGSSVRLLASYVAFTRALFSARRAHRATRRRNARHELHRQRVAAIARAEGLAPTAIWAIDRLSRAPVTRSARRLMSMLMLDRWLLVLGGLAAALVALVALSGPMALVTALVLAIGGPMAAHRISVSTVGSQVPMRSVPERLRRLVDAKVVVFGHTHDPHQAALPLGGVYLNTGTWLPASRPGILRSFTHVLIRVDAAGVARPELRQWRDGKSAPFVELAQARQASRPSTAGDERLGARAGQAVRALGSSPRLPVSGPQEGANSSDPHVIQPVAGAANSALVEEASLPGGVS
jgi:UDP-2,3-diacylglucosamine pyrophosphatase LpxH